MFQLDLFQNPRDTELISLRREVREMKLSLDSKEKSCSLKTEIKIKKYTK